VLHGQDGRATNRNGVQSTPYRSWVKDPGAYASGLFSQVSGWRLRLGLVFPGVGRAVGFTSDYLFLRAGVFVIMAWQL